MKPNTGGPAFPGATYDGPFAGMSLRDFFAAKAMQGLVANDIDCSPEQVPHIVASAYVMADAMLKEREQK